MKTLPSWGWIAAVAFFLSGLIVVAVENIDASDSSFKPLFFAGFPGFVAALLLFGGVHGDSFNFVLFCVNALFYFGVINGAIWFRNKLRASALKKP